MAMFSSRPPFNDDPRPIHLDGGGVRPSLRFSEDDAPWGQRWMEGARVLPRPEFDRPQNNQTNPLLLWARSIGARQALDEMVASDVVGAWVGDLAVTSDHAKHARRVLTRIARIGEVSA